MQKCSLCGGKVVDGRCEECGMPIPPEDRYTLRGENVHVHEVNGEKVLHRQRRAPGKTPFYLCGEKGERKVPPRPAQRPAQPRPARKNSPRPGQTDPARARARSLVWLLVGGALVVSLLSELLTSMTN